MAITQAELAEVLGVSKAMVSKYKAGGLLALVSEDGKERVDPKATLGNLDGNVDPKRIARLRAWLEGDEVTPVAGAGARKADLEIRIRQEKLRTERRNNAVAEGELAPVEEVWAAVATVFAELRSQLALTRKQLAEECLTGEDLRALVAKIKTRDDLVLQQFHARCKDLDPGPEAMEGAEAA